MQCKARSAIHHLEVAYAKQWTVELSRGVIGAQSRLARLQGSIVGSLFRQNSVGYEIVEKLLPKI